MNIFTKLKSLFVRSKPWVGFWGDSVRCYPNESDAKPPAIVITGRGTGWTGNETFSVTGLGFTESHPTEMDILALNDEGYLRVTSAYAEIVRTIAEEAAEAAKPVDLILLKVDPAYMPLYFVIEVERYEDQARTDDHRSYLYNEHTCPTNWTDQVVAVIAGGDDDPHGFAKYVRGVGVTADDEYDYREIFPEAFGDDAD